MCENILLWQSAMMIPNHDHILRELDLEAEPFAVCTLEGACKLYLGKRHEALLHYVIAGTGKLKMSSMADVELHPGRVIFVPAGNRHSLTNDGTDDTTASTSISAELKLDRLVAKGEGNAKMVVLCAAVSLGMRNTNGLVDLLRVPLFLDTDTSCVVERAVQSILEEVTNIRIGCRAMVRLSMQQCALEMLRERLEVDDPSFMWLSGLADQSLWMALRIILDDPGRAHSVESLADAAGMSRSRFARQFQNAYRHAPMSFLRNLRMARAAQMLLNGNEPVKRIAEKHGFQSRSAFTRAFTEFSGQSPRAFRIADH